MRTYKDYFTQFTTTEAKVAVLYDDQAAADEWLSSLSGNHNRDAWRAGEALYQAGIDFDIVNWQQIDASKYQFLLLPSLYAISDEELSQLGKVREKGIKVITIGAVTQRLESYVDVKSSVEQVAGILQVEAQISLPPKIRSLTYTNGKGDYLVHLFNYDYDLSGFKEKRDIKINPNFLSGNYQVYYASLENPELKRLDPANVMVPSLVTYGMLVFKKQ